MLNKPRTLAAKTAGTHVDEEITSLSSYAYYSSTIQIIYASASSDFTDIPLLSSSAPRMLRGSRACRAYPRGCHEDAARMLQGSAPVEFRLYDADLRNAYCVV